MNNTIEQDLIIDLQDVAKTYGQAERATRVLDDVELRVAAGECVFLLGPSGCGKTTLLSIVGCILKPDHGRVRILGRDVVDLGEREQAIFRRHHVGFIFQRFHLLRGLTARENVAVPLLLDGWPEEKANAHGEQLLQAVGLGHRTRVVAGRLSGGECQRVAIARALACDPDLILADEPTASLDAENGQRVMELLCDLAAEHHKTVIVVTHDERIVPFADRVCHMRDGSIVESIKQHSVLVG